jgi:hypothetical protein
MSAEKKANSEKPSTPDRVDPLTVGPVIKPLGKLKRAHNKLVNLIRTITCKGGLKVSISDGRLIFDASQITGASEGAAIDVVGSDGKLNKVPKHSTWAAPSTYPSELRVGSTFHARMEPLVVMVQNSTGSVFTALNSSQISMQGAHSLIIAESALTKDMAIREIDVCSGGVAKKMLVIASAPY